MKKRFIWHFTGLLLLLAALLVACGADTDSAAEPAAEADSPITALESVTDEEMTPTMTDDPATEDDSASGQATVGEPVAPVEVDLSKLTPEPADGSGENIIMPAPGRPGPPADLLESVTLDLERRLNMTRSDAGLVLESHEIMNWPDAGLGCPAPDMMYATVLTPGYQLQFLANGETYVYHTDMAGHFVLCVDGQPAD